MKDDLLIEMARRAGGDTALMAALLKQYAEARHLSWEQMAARLGLDGVQLARLALCRRPRPQRLMEDVGQIAQYVGLGHEALLRFLHDAERVTAAPQPILPTWGRGAREMARTLWKWGLAAVGVLLVLAMIFAQPQRAEATLVVTQGQATLYQGRTVLLVISAPVETVLVAGEATTIRAGDSIALGEGSAAELRLLDGSTVTLYENTTLEVSRLQIGGRAYHVRLDVLAGNIYNRVLRLLGVDDTYEIITPSSTASVRGTAFAVQVLSPEATYFACDEGQIAVRMADQEVTVNAGEQVIAVQGEPLEVQPQPDITPPPLTLLSPLERPMVGSTVVVRGKTEPGATVTVAGRRVEVDAGGAFEVQLVVGTNPIIIEAKDAAGNVIAVQITPRE